MPIDLVAMRLRGGTTTIAWPAERLAAEGPPRGTPLFDARMCTSCGDCVDACPSSCLSLPEGAPAPLLDVGPCLRCGICVQSCDVCAVALVGPDRPVAYSRDDLVMDGSPPEAQEVGPPASRLYRGAVSEGDHVVPPEVLLERRARSLRLPDTE